MSSRIYHISCEQVQILRKLTCNMSVISILDKIDSGRSNSILINRQISEVDKIDHTVSSDYRLDRFSSISIDNQIDKYKYWTDTTPGEFSQPGGEGKEGVVLFNARALKLLFFS